ncbi:MAG: rRNA adenine dimethyltransferase family protein, partial [Candidatus Acidiferrales bacterium]
TSPILTRLFSCAAQIDSIHIVIQYEVAARIAATPGHREYAYLSAVCQYFTRPEIILRIPPGAFRPPPKVNSALVAMSLPGERAHLNIRDDAAFLKFLQNCFSHKRKTLRNNLKDRFADETIGVALAACQLTPKARAEEMSLPQFAQLYRRLAPEK